MSELLTIEIIEKYKDIHPADAHLDIDGMMVGVDEICDALLATMQREAVIEGQRQAAVLVIQQLEAENKRLQEALAAIDKQALQVMQDDVPPYGSILRCGWVHEVCVKALRYEV